MSLVLVVAAFVSSAGWRIIAAQEDVQTPSQKTKDAVDKFNAAPAAIGKALQGLKEAARAKLQQTLGGKREPDANPDSNDPSLPKTNNGPAGTERFSPAGKRDPFRPLTLNTKASSQRRQNLSPLERFELGQLKVVGIVWDIKEPRAMIEDTAGFGYIVKVGTPIGSGEGRVKGIYLFRRWASNDLNRSALCLLLIGTGCATMSVSCSMNADKDRAAQTDAKAPTSSQNQPAAKAPPKEANPALTALTLQELSVREERGQTTLLVKFSQPVTQFRHFPLPQPSRIVLDIFGEAKALSQAETFRIETNWVAALRLSATEGSLRLVTDIAAANVPPYTITPENGGLKITVGALDPNVVTKKDVTLVRGGRRMDVRAAEAVEKKSVTADDLLSTDKKYTGQKISLDFKDADIKNVFRLLAEVSGLNIIVTPDVNRKVTVRLVEVPWDQALDLLVDTNGLGKEQLGNVVRISTAGQLKSEKDALAAARRANEDLEPLQTIYFNVNYAKVKDLEPKVKSLLSKRPDAALVTDERSNTIMVRDIRKVVDDVNTLVAKLDARTPQVLIESNLIETTPSFSRALGLELDSIFNNARILASSRFLAGAPFAGGPQGITNQLVVPDSGFRFGYFGNNVRGILSAAENEGKIKIISRPSVVTLNNVASTAAAPQRGLQWQRRRYPSAST